MVVESTMILQVLEVPKGCTALICAIEAITGKVALWKKEGEIVYVELVDGDPSTDIPILEAAGFKVGLVPF